MVQPRTLHDMPTVVGMFCVFRYEWAHLIDLTIMNSESHQIGFIPCSNCRFFLPSVINETSDLCGI